MLNELPAEKAYRILESGPIVLVATRRRGSRQPDDNGFSHDDAATRRWSAPSSGHGTTAQALSDTGECVLAVPTVDLAETVVDIGNCSGDALDKFAHFGLTPASAQTVEAPLVRECWANLECRVADDGWARRYNLWVLEVQRVWIDAARKETRLIHHQGDGRFSVDGDTLDLGERMVSGGT